ncbi:Protein of unknown function [Marinactinospora thermotolerans DSM 45154]|uniref:Acyclic terpene utilisation N-terminal domain-containing protein n=2 Tax=Marinactinospora thermotolerans TaxID=531310 RepID=A0A1T4P519_9ACTN|nr:Protein of unknown function [Marinactinospora thermotolerans DSM 45154]
MTATRMRIGCGAGFAGDRVTPAVDLIERGGLDVVVLECLGERTVALAQARRLTGTGPGYDPLLARRMKALLGPLHRHGTRLVTNAGSADPLGAARMVAGLTRAAGVPLRVAAVLGDDVTDLIDPASPAWEDGRPLEAHGEIVSAGAYIGADALLPALETDAQVILTGRMADPSLFLGPLMHAFGWADTDLDLLARGTVVGHLLECAGQVSGGYFAGPGPTSVPRLADLGYPLAEVDPDGGAVLTKTPGTGGRVDRHTVVEQLTYEVIDPRAYLTPDVAADLTTVGVHDLGGDRVRVSGARGRPRPAELKVSVGYRAGFRGEAEIGYAGRDARARARLAAEVVRERLSGVVPRLRADLIGVDALYGGPVSDGEGPYECRLRVAGIGPDRETAEAVAEEVGALYTCGPAGGGGVRSSVTEVIGVVSTGVPREAVTTRVEVVGDEGRDVGTR